MCFAAACSRRQDLGRYAGFELAQLQGLCQPQTAVMMLHAAQHPDLDNICMPFIDSLGSETTTCREQRSTACCCRQGLGRYAGFELGQRAQLQELFDELGNPGAKRSAGAQLLVP